MNLLPLEPPSRDLHFTPLVSTEHKAELPVLSSSFPLAPCLNHQISSVQFTCSVMSKFLRPHGLQHARPPCSSPTRRVYSNSCPLSRRCHPTISSSVVPFSSPLQSFPASGAFQMSQLFTWGGQRTGVSASASVLPMNTQDWSPLGWTGWISVQSKGLARVFSSISAMVVYVCQEGSSVCPPLLLPCPHICSLYLCKYCLNRYIWNLKKKKKKKKC